MNLELSRRREECIQLRTVLASVTRSAAQRSAAEGRESTIVSDDGELEMAYKTQKDLNKLLRSLLSICVVIMFICFKHVWFVNEFVVHNSDCP